VLAAEQPAVWCLAVLGNVGAQDGHEFARNGNDADSAAGTVLEAPLFVAVSGVGPLLADHGRGLVKFKTPPAPW